MSGLSYWLAFAALVGLVALSAFFSSSETSMMALNRYRLRHLAEQGHRGARRAKRLLDRPDRLIGLILLGNNFVNILASSLATLIAVQLWGNAGVPIAAVVLTIVILIFAEVAPKTLAAVHPERIAFPASLILLPLLRLLYPVVVALNWLSNGLLKVLGASTEDGEDDTLSADELRTVLNQTGSHISRRHRAMLLSILDLDNVMVDDIMVPRAEIHGIDLADNERAIAEALLHSQHTRLPIYRGDMENVEGVVHLRKLLESALQGKLTKDAVLDACDDPYYVPRGTPLHTQLVNFQSKEERFALVVDEYGDIDGVVTLEDILEEIVGQFTTDPNDLSHDVHQQEDGSYLIDGSATIRELNRTMQWQLPAQGPRTVNGLILEYMEAIPQRGTSLRIGGYPVEIIQTKDNVVKTAKIMPDLWRPPASEDEGKENS
ncbi:MAG: DUF21 domain-containing protein [Gammaproteobacteria bacterium]|nr:DUF21 domain-containing protein [Gammaproteobacteria bacterium]